MWCSITVREAVVSGTSITFDKVPAGRYRVSYGLGDPSKTQADIILPGARVSSGWQEVEIGGRDTSVHVDSWNGVTVSGKVMLPSAAGQVRAMVCLNAVDESDRYCADTEPDGTFTISSVPRDDYAVAVAPARGRDPSVLPAVRSVTVNGHDVTDRPIHLTKNSEILATLTDRQTMVSGLVQGSAELLLQSFVVAFPTDSSMWTGFGPQPRRLRKAKVIDGKFTIRSLPAGDYWLVALREDLSVDWRWQFPERLQSWLPRATRLFLGEGETASIDLGLTLTRK
jgi:hypothetical protein